MKTWTNLKTYRTHSDKYTLDSLDKHFGEFSYSTECCYASNNTVTLISHYKINHIAPTIEIISTTALSLTSQYTQQM